MAHNHWFMLKWLIPKPKTGATTGTPSVESQSKAEAVNTPSCQNTHSKLLPTRNSAPSAKRSPVTDNKSKNTKRSAPVVDTPPPEPKSKRLKAQRASMLAEEDDSEVDEGIKAEVEERDEEGEEGEEGEDGQSESESSSASEAGESEGAAASSDAKSGGGVGGEEEEEEEEEQPETLDRIVQERR